MAKNKRPQDRQQKQDEIVTVARQLFLEKGYDATSMSQLATAAGVAPNTIYWYFDDKDDVLIAVLNSVVTVSFQEYQQANLPKPTDKLLWLVEKLEQASLLVSTVHARLHVSSAIATWHDNFHRLGESMIAYELSQHNVPVERLEALVKISIFTIEGMLVHPLSPAQKQAICDTLSTTLG